MKFLIKESQNIPLRKVIQEHMLKEGIPIEATEKQYVHHDGEEFSRKTFRYKFGYNPEYDTLFLLTDHTNKPDATYLEPINYGSEGNNIAIALRRKLGKETAFYNITFSKDILKLMPFLFKTKESERMIFEIAISFDHKNMIYFDIQVPNFWKILSFFKPDGQDQHSGEYNLNITPTKKAVSMKFSFYHKEYGGSKQFYNKSYAELDNFIKNAKATDLTK